MKLILISAVMQTSKIVGFGAQKIHTHTLKIQRTQNEKLFGADFGPEAYLGHFSSKMSKERPLPTMSTIISHAERIFIHKN